MSFIGSDIGSAAVAFASTLLSELLSFISNYMKQAYPALDSEKGKDQFSKMRNRIIMSQRKRRRRRKFSSQSSDHSNSDDEHLIFKQDEDLSDLSEGIMWDLLLSSFSYAMSKIAIFILFLTI